MIPMAGGTVVVMIV